MRPHSFNVLSIALVLTGIARAETSVYSPPAYTSVFTPPPYTPSGCPSAYTPPPYTSTYTPKPITVSYSTEGYTSVYTPPTHTRVYTPPPYTPSGYSTEVTPTPYTTIVTPEPYTSVYTPPVEYTSVYSPPAYTSVYTIPPYTPSGSSKLYTPPVYTSVYTPPPYTSVYSPPYVPSGYTSVSTPDVYTSVISPPVYTPSGSSDAYTPPPYTSVVTPSAYTTVYVPPVYGSSSSSSEDKAPSSYISSSKSPVYTSPSTSDYTPPASYHTPQFTSVAFPTYVEPTPSEYTPSTYVPGPGETSYVPATDAPTYIPPNPYSSATTVIVIDNPVETGTYTNGTTVTTNGTTNGTTDGTDGTDGAANLGFTPVVGPPKVELRLPIDELQAQFPDVWNMFLIGLEAMMAVDESKDLSYYQISGIHGLPHIPWQYPISSAQDPNRGYCTHASALFSTWHRPYLILIEQVLYNHAVAEAKKFTGPDAQKYQDAAKKVRLPYWDWAAESTKSHLPASMTVETMNVIKPAPGTGEPITANIPNPLYSYTFTRDDYRQTYFDAGIFRDTPGTRRQPDGSGSSRNALADQEMTNTYDSRRQNTYNLFSIPTFQGFTSNAWDGGSAPNAWTSIESIHNDIHSNLGGAGGHMSYVDYAAFDPIFWLHHCNVDRLTAMYQAVWPGNVVEPQSASGTFARRTRPGDMDDINTPLYPFRHPNGAEWTSNDVSTAGSIYKYGYAYPEVPVEYQSRSTEELRNFTTEKVNELYRPALRSSVTTTPSGDTVRREWIAVLAVDTADIPGDFQNLLFVGDVPKNVADWKTADNLVGESATFGADKPMHNVIQASIPLTQILIDKGVGLDPESAVKFLKQECHWVTKQGGASVPLSELKSLKVAITSTEVEYPEDKSQLAIWGQPYVHTEVTEGKEGGMQPNETYLVQSEVAPLVLDGTTTDSNSTSPARLRERSRPWRLVL